MVIAINLAKTVNYKDSDYKLQYVAGWILRYRADPYDEEQYAAWNAKISTAWHPDPILIYPLPYALIHAPQSLLPLPVAYGTWVFLSQIFVLGAVALVRRGQ